MAAFVKINKDGVVHDLNEQPLSDLDVIHHLLSTLKLDSNHTYRAELHDKNVIVEPFSFPIIVSNINATENELLDVDCINEYTTHLDLNKIYLDYQDRFVIYTQEGIPALLNPHAQDQLFDMADSFSDEAIVISGKQYKTPMWIGSDKLLSNAQAWSDRYETEETGWDIGAPSPSLVWAVEKLKLPKMRVAVLGSGSGHDAQFLASKGHMVTGFDFSPEAIKKAEALYPSQSNLKWVCKDIFQLSAEYQNSFDLVIEHTCFCAIDPERRPELVNVWRQILSPEGQVLGVFFVMPKTYGPPYGSTEEELDDLLSPNFRYNMWNRSRASHPKRLGRELIVLTRLKKRHG